MARRTHRSPPPDVVLRGVVHTYFDVDATPTSDGRTYFDHGVEDSQALIDHHREHSHGATGFVGIWHTHPHGRAKSSPTDKAGMAALTNYAGAGNRAMMLILAGQPQAWSAWIDRNKPPNVYVRIVHRKPSTTPQQTTGRVQAPPPQGSYFPGGFSYPPPRFRPRPWWRLLSRKRRHQ